MAHILLCWELGGNRGHATLLSAVAAVLRARGHRISFAVQRVDALAGELEEGAPVWPAPVTPRLLVNTGRPRKGANSMGDILARLGCDDADLFEALLRAWRQLLAAIRPDSAIGNYAPFLLTAARGLMPTIAVGTWFNTPPSAMPAFPSLNGEAPCFDEGALLGNVNRALGRLGGERLDRLPGLVAASREIAGSIAELDFYSAWRPAALAAPMVAGGVPPLAAGGGEEVFVYSPEQVGPDAALWRGLARSGLPVRVHAIGMVPELAAVLAGHGFRVERGPVPFARIVERSRLVVSHGGHGFVCSALMAGLPQLIASFDIEKHAHANFDRPPRRGRQGADEPNRSGGLRRHPARALPRRCSAGPRPGRRRRDSPPLRPNDGGNRRRRGGRVAGRAGDIAVSDRTGPVPTVPRRAARASPTESRANSAPKRHSRQNGRDRPASRNEPAFVPLLRKDLFVGLGPGSFWGG